MISVKVTYTVNPAYVETNRINIEVFLKDFEKMDNSRFVYAVFRQGENTFVHLSQYRDEKMQKELLAKPSFVAFQQQRDKNLAAEPQIAELDFIGSSHNLIQ